MTPPLEDPTKFTPPPAGGRGRFDDPVDAAEERPNPAVESFHRLKRDLDELKEYGSLYIATRIDGIKRTVRNIGLYAAVGVLGLIAGGALVATAVGLIVVGIANLLSELFGGRVWLGNMATGILILAILAGGVWFMMNKLTGTWRSQTMKKYEQRKQAQRERFGHDVAQRAAEDRSGKGH